MSARPNNGRLHVHHPLFAGFLGVVALFFILTITLVTRGLRREMEEL
jgi:hypothetical protein